jgi:hypothetical protein
MYKNILLDQCYIDAAPATNIRVHLGKQNFKNWLKLIFLIRNHVQYNKKLQNVFLYLKGFYF